MQHIRLFAHRSILRPFAESQKGASPKMYPTDKDRTGHDDILVYLTLKKPKKLKVEGELYKETYLREMKAFLDKRIANPKYFFRYHEILHSLQTYEGVKKSLSRRFFVALIFFSVYFLVPAIETTTLNTFLKTGILAQGCLIVMSVPWLLYFRRNKIRSIILSPSVRPKSIEIITLSERIQVDINKIEIDEKSLMVLAAKKDLMEKIVIADSDKRIQFDGQIDPYEDCCIFLKVTDQKGTVRELVLDLEIDLFRVDNYDLLFDVLSGNLKEVSKYKLVSQEEFKALSK